MVFDTDLSSVDLTKIGLWTPEELAGVCEVKDDIFAPLKEIGRKVRLATCRSGNCGREASVEGKVRDGGCQLSLSNTVINCTMKMRR